MLHAFALLGHLAESDLKFVFKGGTSLLLHLPVIRRLSIDIDILCSAPTAELDRILGEVAKAAPFIRYEEDERGSRGLPRRRHFKFFYTPLVAGNPAPYVFLDVVEETHIPHELVVKPIAPEILEIRREILVTVHHLFLKTNIEEEDILRLIHWKTQYKLHTCFACTD